MAIETGQAATVLIVDGEGSRHTQLATIDRLRQPTATAVDVFDQFASLTLGSGAAAMVMGGPRDGAHRYVGGISRAATVNHDLCVGDLDTMRTDTAALLENGLALAKDAFVASVEAGWEWTTCDRYVMHQVSAVHTRQALRPPRASTWTSSRSPTPDSATWAPPPCPTRCRPSPTELAPVSGCC